MAHYAVIDPQTMKVASVFVGRNEDDLAEGIDDWEQYYALAGMLVRRTSYNTHGGVHAGGATPYRKNYAGVGFSWDQSRDAFIPPQPYPSWVLDDDSCLWQPPTPYPDDGNPYVWNEDTLTWVEVEQ